MHRRGTANGQSQYQDGTTEMWMKEEKKKNHAPRNVVLGTCGPKKWMRVADDRQRK